MIARHHAAPLLLFAVLALFVVFIALHETLTPAQSHFPLTFPHAPHEGYACSVCHHDFGKPVFDSWPHKHCVACHVLTPSLAPTAERDFHALCESCHRDARRQKLPAGPILDCIACHIVRPTGRRGTFVFH